MMKHSFTNPAAAGTAISRKSALAAGMVLASVACGASAWAQAGQPNFGPNVIVVDPGTPSAQIDARLASLANEDQFSTNRYAVLFKPGAYAVEAKVGYYEQIAGLGATPGGVTVTGFLTPNFGTTAEYFPGTEVLDTFWRSMENMTFDVQTNTDQNAAPNTLQWGVSQAAPLRRLQVNGSLQLVDTYCGEASGGFISDIVVTGSVGSCSQQQWYTRNSTLGSWNGVLWNMTFSGVEGAPVQSYPNPAYTTLETTRASREKPFLYIDDKGGYNVFSPALRVNGRGASWAAGNEAGRSIPINRFFIAYPSTPVRDINVALALGKNLILTPGIYKLSGSINVLYPNTVVLGMGYATLVPQTGRAAIQVTDVSGVQIAGLLIDAGPVNSPVLLHMGTGFFGYPLPRGGLFSHARNPSSLSDVFFRIGGGTPGRATTSLQVDSSDVILDNIWAWRADHGNGVGWTQNVGEHGLVVNGDNVTATGLFVEHYEQEQVLWNGNNGQTVFYQSELPYDPPSQALWTDGTANGYPSYVVSSGVTTHTAYGMGIYSFFNQGIDIVEDNAMTVPQVPGVAVRDGGTVWLTGSGSITHVINGQGATVDSVNHDVLSPVTNYP